MARRTKIVATIGPASSDPEILARMIEAGMDVARLNFSHGTAEQHAEMAQRVRTAAGRVGRPVAIMQDLPGPKLRIGPLRDGTADLGIGDRLTFVCNGGAGELGDEKRMTITWPGLAAAVEPGEIMYLLDGSIRLRVTATRVGDGEIDTEVEVGGTVASRQGLNIPGEATDLPAVPEEDLDHLRVGMQIGVDLVALSFVRRPEDVLFVREHTRTPLIVKVEKPQAVDRAEAILDGSDAVMLSQESAVGRHPVGAIQMMDQIARVTEVELPYERWNELRVRRDERDPAYTLAHSACVAARELHLDALVVPTLSGRSARLISAHRPNVPIYALSPGKETVRRCGLMWGVQASSMRRHEITEALIADAAARVVELGWCKRGQRVGITAGLPSGRPGTTSLLQIQQL